MTIDRSTTLIALLGAALASGCNKRPSPPPIRTAPPVTWHISQYRDPFSDEVTVTAAKPGDGGTLLIRCDRKSGAMWPEARFSTFLGSTNPTPWDMRHVTYRFDQGSPVTSLWFIAKDMISQTRDRPVADFLQNIGDAETVAFRTGTYEGVAATLVANLDNIRPTLNRLSQLCPRTNELNAVISLLSKNSEQIRLATIGLNANE